MNTTRKRDLASETSIAIKTAPARTFQYIRRNVKNIQEGHKAAISTNQVRKDMASS